MTELSAKDISLTRKGLPALSPVSLTLSPGQLTALIGPNGAGKTSLLRVLTGQYAPDSGSVNLGEHALETLSAPQRARLLSYLPQLRPLAWPSRVYDVVALGRFAYGGGVGRLSDTDTTAIAQALSDCELDGLSERRADTLSGGELARLHCARAFAANAPLLIADEPIAALDPAHQLRILDLIRAYVNRGNGALIVLHDMNLAMRYADNVLLMDQGALVANGPPQEVLTTAQIQSVFNVTAEVKDGHIYI